MTQIGKKILNYIQENFQSGEEEELSKYINENVDDILMYCDIKDDNRDSFIDDFCYNSSARFDDFAKELIDNNTGDFLRVNIELRNAFYYLSRSTYAVNSDSESVERYIKKLEGLCISDRQDKGYIYEIFCQKWLLEFCSNVELTPKSNDKGIDIVGTILAQTSFDELSKICIQLLAQVKLNKNKVDVPVIRHLIGDSIFLSFEKNESSIFSPTLLCVISHSGFSRIAKKFAKEHHIFLLDSERMIKMLEKKGKLKDFDCIKYLDKIQI